MSRPEVRCPACSAKAKPVPGKAGRYRCRDCDETFKVNDLSDEEQEPKRRAGRRREEEEEEEPSGPSPVTLAAVVVVGLFGLVSLGTAGYFILKKDPPKDAVVAADTPAPKVENSEPLAKDTKPNDPLPEVDQPKPPTAEEIVRRVKAATAYIRTPQGTGSGFFAGNPGFVLTNAHVIGYGPQVIRPPARVEVVVASGEAEERTLAAKIYGVDAEIDLALLYVEGEGLPAPLPFGKAAELVETQDVVVYGYPFGELLGKNISINRSTVSSLRKEGGKITFVQLSGGLNPGNSGGPVTNTKGEIVGVSVAKLRGAESIAFAIPAEVAESFLQNQYSTGGRIETGGLVTMVPNPVRPSPGPPAPARPPMTPTVIPPLELPPVKPVPITAAEIPRAGTELKLPAEADQVCVGGGGRFLIASLPAVKQIAVVDLSRAKVAKLLPAASERMLVAAGMNTLFVLYPGTNVVQRWSLTSFEKEGTGTIAPAAGLVVTNIAMGSASNGPVLIQAMDFPRLGERFLFDITTMEPVPGTRKHDSTQGTWPGDTLRASANGKVVTVSRKEGGVCFLALKGAGWTEHRAPWRDASQPAAPSADGQTVYGPGDMATPAGQRVGEPVTGGGVWSVPALHGPFVLVATQQKGDTKHPLKMAIHAPRDNKPLFELPQFAAADALCSSSGECVAATHVFFAPQAKVVAVLSKAKDRVMLHPVDVEAELAKPDRSYLFVTSHPGAVTPGKRFEYAIEARSKKGGLTFKRDFGPPGLAVSSDGKVTWDVPANFGEPVNAVVTITDRSGQNVLYLFELVPAPK